MSRKVSGSTWIFGLVVFLLCINAAYALVELVVGGPEAEVNILFVVGGTYGVPVSVYFLTSVLVASVSFGYLCSLVIGELAMESAVIKIVGAFEAKLQGNRRQLEKVVTSKFAKLSMDQFEIAEGLKNIEMQLRENQKRVEKIGEMRDKYGETLKRQIVALGEVEKKIEEIEFQLTPKPCLTSRSDVQEVSGVGKKTAEELKSVGITNVEDLVIEEAAVIGRRTNLSRKKVEKIQAAAQLLMIPGIDEKEVRLLQKAGITSVDKLAGQSPIRLFRKMASVSGNSDDRPTLEEVASYVKFARSYLGVS